MTSVAAELWLLCSPLHVKLILLLPNINQKCFFKNGIRCGLYKFNYNLRDCKANTGGIGDIWHKRCFEVYRMQMENANISRRFLQVLTRCPTSCTCLVVSDTVRSSLLLFRFHIRSLIGWLVDLFRSSSNNRVIGIRDFRNFIKNKSAEKLVHIFIDKTQNPQI